VFDHGEAAPRELSIVSADFVSKIAQIDDPIDR